MFFGMCRDHLYTLLKQDYENKLKSLKLGASTEQAQFGYRKDPSGVIHLTDEEFTDFESAYYPVENSQTGSEERRKAEISQLNEDFQKRLRTMEEVFDKAGVPDRPGEVGIFNFFRIVMNRLWTNTIFSRDTKSTPEANRTCCVLVPMVGVHN